MPLHAKANAGNDSKPQRKKNTCETKRYGAW